MAETYTNTVDDVVVGDVDVFSEPETILSGENLAKWTVVGRVTASGKWVKSLSASSDGSQTPRGILVEAVDASAGDVVGPVYKKGHFDPTKLVYGASHTATTVKAALEGTGIFLREPLAI
jgi:hypothetical protein